MRGGGKVGSGWGKGRCGGGVRRDKDLGESRGGDGDDRKERRERMGRKEGRKEVEM